MYINNVWFFCQRVLLRSLISLNSDILNQWCSNVIKRNDITNTNLIWNMYTQVLIQDREENLNYNINHISHLIHSHSILFPSQNILLFWNIPVWHNIQSNYTIYSLIYCYFMMVFVTTQHISYIWVTYSVMVPINREVSWGHKLVACITFWPRQHWAQWMEEIILNDQINWFQHKKSNLKKYSGLLFYLILFLVPIIDKVENASGEHVFNGLKSCSIIPKPEEKHVNGLYFKILLY